MGLAPQRTVLTRVNGQGCQQRCVGAPDELCGGFGSNYTVFNVSEALGLGTHM
jgi:hypothetical protein